MRAALCVRGASLLALAALVCSVGGLRIAAWSARRRAEVVAAWPATATCAASGERLLYSELPAGFAAYNLDFDASGCSWCATSRCSRSSGSRTAIGTWTRADLQNTFGMPLRGSSRWRA